MHAKTQEPGKFETRNPLKPSARAWRPKAPSHPGKLIRRRRTVPWLPASEALAPGFEVARSIFIAQPDILKKWAAFPSEDIRIFVKADACFSRWKLGGGKPGIERNVVMLLPCRESVDYESGIWSTEIERPSYQAAGA